MTIFQNRTILITGSCGFIGSNLAEKIIKYNPKKLIIFDNLCQSSIDNIKYLFSDERVEFIKGDIRNKNIIEKYVLESDYVFHLAAGDVGSSEIYPKDNIETNILGTFNILEAIKKKLEIRMVHVSSGSVVNPSTIYSISKLSGEQLCSFYAKEFGVKVSIIRPHHVYGKYQNIFGTSGVINKFLYRILINKSPIIFGDGSQRKRFTYVQDVISAILLLAEKDKSIGKIYDVASNTDISIKKLAKILIKKYAKDKKMKLIYDKPKIGENMQLFPDITNIKRLGWKQKWDFENGLTVSKSWVESKIRNKNYV